MPTPTDETGFSWLTPYHAPTGFVDNHSLRVCHRCWAVVNLRDIDEHRRWHTWLKQAQQPTLPHMMGYGDPS